MISDLLDSPDLSGRVTGQFHWSIIIEKVCIGNLELSDSPKISGESPELITRVTSIH